MGDIYMYGKDLLIRLPLRPTSKVSAVKRTLG